jgi:DNA-binding GntR family transcriptional regulator
MQSLSIENAGNGYQRDQAYERLRRLLILQQVPEGERLREAEWAARLGVNRTALREAFARLAAEGVIEQGPKTGYFVPKLSSQDILEVMEVRIVLEGGAIERVCRLGLNTPEHLESMRKACDQFDLLLREGYLLGVAEADRRFHEALIDAAGNRRLALLYHRAPLPIIYPRMFSQQQWLARAARDTLNEHCAILETILKGDVLRAQNLLRSHLTERYMTTLRND